MKKKYIKTNEWEGYDRRDGNMTNNQNGWILKTLIGFLWFVLTISIISTINAVVANDKDSRARDICEAEKRGELNREAIRLDTNQKEVIKKVDKVLDNQETMTKTLIRLETKIERL